MSKSYNNYLWLLDDEKTLRKKVKQITTASLGIEASKNPDECNVYLLTKLFTNQEEDKNLRDRYLAGGMGYGEAKEFLTEKLLAFTWEIQQIYHALTDEEIVTIIDRGTQKAYDIATKKINEINEKVGFVL
jgi:tryptophanyl-tRNA synthetase